MIDKSIKAIMSNRIALYSGLALAIGAASQMLLNFLIARDGGTEVAGRFFISVTLLIATSATVRLGLDLAVVRFGADYQANNMPGKLIDLFKKTISIVLSTSIIAGLIIFFSSNWLANSVFEDALLSDFLRRGAIALPLFSLTIIFSEIIRSQHGVVIAALTKNTIIYSGAVVSFLVLSPSDTRSIDAFAIGITAALITGLVALARVWPRTKSSSINTKTLLLTALPLLAAVFLNLILEWIDIFMLGILTDTSKVGAYTIAARLAMTVSFVLVVANAVFVPQFSKLYSTNKHQQLNDLVVKITKSITLIAMPIAIILILLSGFILELFGDGFSQAQSSLILLTLGQLVSVSVGSVAFLLAMTGHQTSLAKTIGFIAVINFLLNLVLIPAFGIIGAAIATSFSVAARNILLYWQVTRKLNINVWGIKNGK